MRLLDKLLVLFLVSTSIFRIDLASGKLGFILTPGLVLAMLLICVLIIAFLFRQSLKISTYILFFSILLLGIAGWFLIVTISFQDILQIKRLILFYIIIASTISFFIIFNYSANKLQIINKFIFYSLYIYLVFSFFQIIFFINGKHYGVHTELFPFIKLYPASIGPYFPRLTGGFNDPNVGGYFLTFLFIMIHQLNLTKKFNWVIVLLIFLTLSRSAILAFLMVAIATKIYSYFLKYQASSYQIKVQKQYIYRAIIALVAIICTSSYVLFYTNIGKRFEDAISARLGNEDNSTSIHFGLFKIAIEKIFDNPVSFLKGYGFGSSFLFTQEYFPNNKYGNFHSELITIFVETGVIGLMLFLSIFIIPLLKIFLTSTFNKHFYIILLILSIFLQNVFYQQYLFQYYWIIIGFIWYIQATNHNKQFRPELSSPTS